MLLETKKKIKKLKKINKKHYVYKNVCNCLLYVNYKYKQAQKKGLVSYTDYQYELLYGKTKPVEKVKFTLKVKDEYF